MLNVIEKNIPLTKLKRQLDLEIYQFKRYKIPFCLLLIEHSIGNLKEHIQNNIRKTDSVIKIEKNLTAIIFRFTDFKNGGYRAAINLFHFLEKTNPKTKIYGGISCADYESVENIINRAIFALNKAKSKNFSNIEDDYLF